MKIADVVTASGLTEEQIKRAVLNPPQLPKPVEQKPFSFDRVVAKKGLPAFGGFKHGEFSIVTARHNGGISKLNPNRSKP